MAIQRRDQSTVTKKFGKRNRRVLRKMFYKRSTSRKGNELAQLTGAEISIAVYLNNNYHIYKSTDRPEWPRSEQEIVSLY